MHASMRRTLCLLWGLLAALPLSAQVRTETLIHTFDRGQAKAVVGESALQSAPIALGVAGPPFVAVAPILHYARHSALSALPALASRRPGAAPGTAPGHYQSRFECVSAGPAHCRCRRRALRPAGLRAAKELGLQPGTRRCLLPHDPYHRYPLVGPPFGRTDQ